jgi:hypothetical protein
MMNNWLSVTMIILVVVGFLFGGLYALIEYEDYQHYAGYKETGRASLTSFCNVLTSMPDYRCTEWVNDVMGGDIENGYNIIFCENMYMNPSGIYNTDSFRKDGHESS